MKSEKEIKLQKRKDDYQKAKESAIVEIEFGIKKEGDNNILPYFKIIGDKSKLPELFTGLIVQDLTIVDKLAKGLAFRDVAEELDVLTKADNGVKLLVEESFENLKQKFNDIKTQVSSEEEKQIVKNIGLPTGENKVMYQFFMNDEVTGGINAGPIIIKELLLTHAVLIKNEMSKPISLAISKLLTMNKVSVIQNEESDNPLLELFKQMGKQ